MTSKLSRERLEELAAGQSGFNLRVATYEESQELARIALAAMDGEPDCNERKLFCSTDTARMRKVISVSAGSEATPLHLHAQPAPKTEREPIAWLNDAYLARGVVDGEAGSEDAGPGYIPVYREPATQPAPVVPDVMEPTIEAIKRILPTSNPDEYAACIGADMWNACRAAMLSGGKS